METQFLKKSDPLEAIWGIEKVLAIINDDDEPSFHFLSVSGNGFYQVFHYIKK